MLSEKLVSKSELLVWIKRKVANYCDKNGLPVLPVKYGAVPPSAKAVFANLPVRMQVWEEYSEWLSSHSPSNRVWHVNHALYHELWHYRQYLFAKEHGKRITLSIFSESDAYSHGDVSADEVLSRMSTEEINPILPLIGENIIAGLGLGIGFKAVENLFKPKRNPKKRR